MAEIVHRERWIGLRIDQDLYDAVVNAAAQSDRPLSSIVRLALKDYLRQRDTAAPAKRQRA